MSTNMEEPFKPDLRQLTKSKIMGKLFGKSKHRVKDTDDICATGDDDVLDFLKGAPNDKLQMAGVVTSQHSVPPLARLNTSNTQHSPIDENTTPPPSYIPPSKRAKRDIQGLTVQFTNKWPEIIGFGGEEFEEPTIEISRAKEKSIDRPEPILASDAKQQAHASPQRRAMHRTQTGMPSATDTSPTSQSSPNTQLALGLTSIHIGTMEEQLSMRQQESLQNQTALREAKMRASEGRALHSASIAQQDEPVGRSSTSSASTHSHKSHHSHSSSYGSQTMVPSPITPMTVTDHSMHPLSRDKIHHIGESQTVAPQMSIGTISSVILENNQALDDFASRVQNSYKLFELSADSVKPLRQTSLENIMRLASWWFLKGRAGIEVAARSSGNGVDVHGFVKEQGHADLAKSLWLIESAQQICQDQGGPPVSRVTKSTTGAAFTKFDHILDRCQIIEGHLGKITSSMRRNNFLPPLPEDAPLSAGINNAIWNPPLPVPVDVHSLLSTPGNNKTTATDKPKDVSITMPLGDTSTIFNFNRMFVDVYLKGEGFRGHEEPIQCIMSVSRRCEDTELCLFLTDQSGVLDLSVQSDRYAGLMWDDVKWLTDMRCLDLRLPRGFTARVQLSSSHFTLLYNLFEHVNRVLAAFRPANDEEIVYDKVLKTLDYFDDDPQSTHSFPKQPIAKCHIRLLSKSTRQSTGSGVRTLHCGHRIAIMTGTLTKHTSGLNYCTKNTYPTLYEFMRSPTGDPCLSLNFQQNGQKTRLAMTFNSDHDRSKLHHLLIDGVAADEATLAKVPLKSFSTSDMLGTVMNEKMHRYLAWSSIQVLNRGLEDVTNPEGIKVVHSDHLRLILLSRCGSLTDRINISSGELKIRLCPYHPEQPTMNSKIIIQRGTQDDMTFAVSDSHIPRGTTGEISAYLNCLMIQPTLREYQFSNLADLHAFQVALTGYRVLFDTTATSFAIARRRMVVPIYKKWDCANTRIQIVRSEKIFQLVAWFDGFSHGDSMNFVLKGTDEFEKMGKGDKCGIRLVDAKFPLPSGGKNEDGEAQSGWTKGISLDDPPYPAEHDDITITFASEAERDQFVESLPGSAKVASRMGSLKR